MAKKLSGLARRELIVAVRGRYSTSCGPHLFDRVVDAHAKPMWHHRSVIALFQFVLRLLSDLIALTALAFRRRRATAAEILVLRRQIALYKERGVKPRRIDAVTRTCGVRIRES